MLFRSVMLEGSEDPIGGWVSYGYSRRIPAPQLQLCRTGRAPLRVVTVIAPEGCRADIRFRGDAAVIALSGSCNTVLELEKNRIERKH